MVMKVTGPTAFLGAVSGFFCVGLGAFGAHMLSDPQARDWVDTAVQYQILHTMAAFASLSFRNWGARRARFAPVFFFFGILVFCGSLYAMALGAPRWLGMITPIGGVSFLIGWAVMAWAGWPIFLAARRHEEPKG